MHKTHNVVFAIFALAQHCTVCVTMLLNTIKVQHEPNVYTIIQYVPIMHTNLNCTTWTNCTLWTVCTMLLYTKVQHEPTVCTVCTNHTH